ncbi:MAG TPA: carboxynorspermidine decarboxylase [Chitinophagales bacterium]|nr:carboxynorspermidine decarboxylase [Chitinophagales bacterium]HMW11638.1 carboxynorspermidine decarboxylase [Chitinophagales bacterium]HMX59218.1 carboxynorspermidine decarboxylase [Chitinophagales bacterium]HMY22477.1 carboxynorspermidine decarboxylase [Chitinophagales bacterium]HMZ33854.1 carboxynorspermidine decarboxylase [Chitinophagales bacterium]
MTYDHIPSPSFVLEENKLIKNLQLLKSIQDEADVHIICALKGFSFHAVFPTVKKYIHGATSSSLHEAKLVYEKMNVRAHTYCPVYIPKEFDEIQQISSHITFNSLSQYNTYKHKMIPDISYGLRVNPGYSEITTELYNPASPNSRLGIARNLIGDVLPAGIEGLHFHALCENTSYTLERVLESFIKLYHPLIQQAKWVNFGGGHLITRKDYEPQHLIQILKVFKSKYPNLQEIILEPGSAIGWQTGVLVSTVLDIVPNGNIPTAMLDVSFTCHMPDCLEMPYKPNVLSAVENGTFEYNLGGMSCLAGDFIGTWKFENELKIGDRIVFDDMIHYTMVKTSTFNGINLPSIGVMNENGKFELIRSFSYADYKNRLS